MPDYSLDFYVRHDEGRGSCALSFRCFDTPNSVTVYSMKDAAEAESAVLAARALCLELHRLWSPSMPNSDIARLNSSSTCVEVDPHTARIVSSMKEFAAREPLFDFTVGSVSFLWKHARRLPSASELAQALSHVGAHKVAVEETRVRKADPLLKIDVGGAAKGYAADAVAELLRARGVVSADIDLGGNLFMIGQHPEARPWRVSIKVPEGVEAPREIVEVEDESVVTSGSYERFVEIGGKRYQHIVDPTTGWPSESDIVSATVVAKSSLAADMLATTACLAGSSGMAALESCHPEARFHVIAASS